MQIMNHAKMFDSTIIVYICGYRQDDELVEIKADNAQKTRELAEANKTVAHLTRELDRWDSSVELCCL